MESIGVSAVIWTNHHNNVSDTLGRQAKLKLAKDSSLTSNHALCYGRLELDRNRHPYNVANDHAQHCAHSYLHITMATSSA